MPKGPISRLSVNKKVEKRLCACLLNDPVWTQQYCKSRFCARDDLITHDTSGFFVSRVRKESLDREEIQDAKIDKERHFPQTRKGNLRGGVPLCE